MAYELRLLWHTNPPFFAIWTVFIGGGGGLWFVDPLPPTRNKQNTSKTFTKSSTSPKIDPKQTITEKKLPFLSPISAGCGAISSKLFVDFAVKAASAQNSWVFFLRKVLAWKESCTILPRLSWTFNVPSYSWWEPITLADLVKIHWSGHRRQRLTDHPNDAIEASRADTLGAEIISESMFFAYTTA